MNLRRLAYFMRIAELGSINRASEALRIAQPALSRQIRMLEEELGVVLFERTLRGMTLTEQGERLQRDLAGPLRQIDFAFTNVSLTGSQVAGALNIGLEPGLRDVLSLPLLDRIAEEEPGIVPRIVEGEVDCLAEWAVRGDLDLIIFSGPSPDEAVIDRALLTEDLCLVGPPNSDLRPDHPLRFDAAIAHPLILPEARSGVVPLLEKRAYVNKAGLNIVRRVNSFELLKQMVSRGAGYTVLPKSAMQRELHDGALACCPIVDPVLSQPVSIGATRDCRVPRLVERTDIIIRHTLAALVTSGAWRATLLFEPEAA
jgi:LysR family transcriptional regulator, nitrogen assimilation regulatory protein